jgi:hypothetical protein
MSDRKPNTASRERERLEDSGRSRSRLAPHMRKSMRHILGLLLMGSAVLSLAAEPPAGEKAKAADPKETKQPLVVGKDLPGAFHAFNVNGPRRGRYHCLVSDWGLNPAVLIFCRDMTFSDELKVLLRKLDNCIKKNPNVRLGIFVVFLPDKINHVVTEDDQRDQEVAKIKDLAAQVMLQDVEEKDPKEAKPALIDKVILAVAGKNDLDRYALDDNAVYTIVLEHKYKVLFAEALEKEKLTKEKTDAIIAAIGEKLGAVKK